MFEVNCDDMLDVMKRLRENRALIIRHQARRQEEQRTKGGEHERHVRGRLKKKKKKRTK